jgi:hypothetical protein
MSVQVNEPREDNGPLTVDNLSSFGRIDMVLNTVDTIVSDLEFSDSGNDPIVLAMNQQSTTLKKDV